MVATTKQYDLDLSKMKDGELVVLAQECGFRPAAAELVLRHHQPMGRLLAHKAKRTPLTEADIQDAQQNVVFALLEAIAGYNTFEMVKPGGCSFRSYARLVTTRRFWDFVKHIRRLQNRHRRSTRADDSQSVGTDEHCGGTHCPDLPNERITDPAEAAARREALARLNLALERLAEKMRALWQELVSGKKLRQIAREWSISYDVLKRQRRKLLADLCIELRELRES